MSTPQVGTPPPPKIHRREQILQLIARMLEDPQRPKITTATLASQLDISEATLYRHFKNKAEMFQGLIDFIESSLMQLVNQIETEQARGMDQLHSILQVLILFSTSNPGMTRVLTGDALVHEDHSLQERVLRLHNKIESHFKQCLRLAKTKGEIPDSVDVACCAQVFLCYTIGHWHRFVNQGFVKPDQEQLNHNIRWLLSPCL